MNAAPQPSDPSNLTSAVLLFDGVCNLCNGFVNFVIDRDPNQHFQFAAQQSPAGSAILQQFQLPQTLETIVLVEKGRCYTHSTAVLRAMKSLQGPVSLLHYFLIVPKPIRDFFYRQIARNRYRLFGQQEACRMPTPDLKQRFLDNL